MMEEVVVVGGGFPVYQMNMCQTDRQTDAHSFLPPPSISHLFCFVLLLFSPHRSAVLLFGLIDETLCCLSAFNICLPLTAFSPHLYLFPDFFHLICPFPPVLIFVPVSSPYPISLSFFNLSYTLYCLFFFSVNLSVCVSPSAICYFFSFLLPFTA